MLYIFIYLIRYYLKGCNNKNCPFSMLLLLRPHNIHSDEDHEDVETHDKFCEYKCKIETP